MTILNGFKEFWGFKKFWRSAGLAIGAAVLLSACDDGPSSGSNNNREPSRFTGDLMIVSENTDLVMLGLLSSGRLGERARGSLPA